MNVTRWPVVLYALVDVMRATTGFRAPGADVSESLVLVLDGPEFQMTADTGDVYLMVGGVIDDETTSGDAGQNLAVMGTRARDEDGTVWCQAVAQLGGVFLQDSGLAVGVPQDTWRTLTATCFAVVGAVETACRTDPGLGIAGTPFIVCEIGRVEAPRRYFTDSGAVVSCVFGVDYRARI
jgi:hypothetical protein